MSIPKEIRMNSFDLSSIIGNLLDNAIRETRKAQNPQITISVEYMKESLMITVKNTFVSGKSQELESRNESNDMNLVDIHGVGLKNVEKVVKKYKGEMIIEKEEQWFIVKVICFMNME